MVIEKLIESTGQQSSTLSLNDNRFDVTNDSVESANYSPPRPIAPPPTPSSDLMDDRESDEDNVLAACFNRCPNNRINDTDISVIASQSAIFREVGRPDGWQSKELEIKNIC